MSITSPILTIGFDKNGEDDYALHTGPLETLTYEKMTRMRAMVCVAIGQMEQHWYAAQMRKPENQASQTPAKTP